MPNLSQIKRQRMLDFLEELKKTHNDDASICAFNEIENHIREKKFGLVFEEHTEAVDEMLQDNIPVFCEDPERRICKDKTLPWNFIIEGDNLQALYLLEKTHKGKVDCIYIDPPYNKGAKDWKYNNDYVDVNDTYRHSKWLSMMKSRLKIAKDLLNPKDSVLICTIDEKEYLHLGNLLEELFPEARIQMISTIISNNGNARALQFSRTNEFIFFVMFGDCGPEKLTLSSQWLGNLKVESSKTVDGFQWGRMLRGGNSGRRAYSPGCFYPIYIDINGVYKGVGAPLPLQKDWHTETPPNDWLAIWPIHLDGSEGCWSCQPSLFEELYKKGYIKFGEKITDRGVRITYIQSGMRKRIEDGEIKVVGRDSKNGTVILETDESDAKYIPGTQWAISSHDATYYGTKLLVNIIGKQRFTFPKSLYAVHDAVRFFVANKPNAFIVDFFAGSGTTLHAVNLLNAEDGGHRRCIMVTNNEVSDSEAKALTAQGYHPGDEEWEKLGIARYVTWPRTVCSIEGHDINGKPLKGDYGIETEAYEPDEEAQLISKTTGKPIKKMIYRKVKRQQYPELAKIKMSDGFLTNVKYFKCDWTPRKPEDYLLSNALCLHIKEMIELQNSIEVDNVKNVLILNKEDFRKYVMDDEAYKHIENIWVNQNIVFNSAEMELLNAIGFTYIPKEFFGQELKEAAE